MVFSIKFFHENSVQSCIWVECAKNLALDGWVNGLMGGKDRGDSP
jgi:hypothetical protein